jgi:two-component system chemotaxis response regulator CheY
LIKVLIVDDSPTTGTAIRRMLVPLGYALAEAEDGAEALEYCRSHRGVDVVVLDIDMPVLDELQCLRALRGDVSLRQPAVVMCTTHSSIAKILEAMEAGANEFVMKPFDAEILAGKLASLGAGA